MDFDVVASAASAMDYHTAAAVTIAAAGSEDTDVAEVVEVAEDSVEACFACSDIGSEVGS